MFYFYDYEMKYHCKKSFHMNLKQPLSRKLFYIKLTRTWNLCILQNVSILVLIINMAKSSMLLFVENIFPYFSWYCLLYRARFIFFCNSVTSDYAGPHASGRSSAQTVVDICRNPFNTFVRVYYLLHLFEY